MAWHVLERHNGAAFLSAGGLLLVGGAMSVIQRFFDAPIEGLMGVTVIAGFGLSFVGLLGLYPRLRRSAARLARAGLVLMVLPAAYLVVVVLWLIPTTLVAEWPPLPALVPGEVQWLIFVLFAVGISLFAATSLRTDTPSRVVGALLAILALAWFVILGGELLFEPIPDWVLPAAFAAMIVAMLPLGYRLRSRQASGPASSESLMS